MKNDELKKFVSEHRQEFDFREPDPALWEKIKQKSASEEEKEQPKKGGRIIPIQRFLSRAAAVIIISTLSIGIYEYFDREIINTGGSTAEVEDLEINEEMLIPELQEVEHYYSAEIDRKMEELSKFTSTDSELKQDITTDMDELDQAYDELKDDLKEAVATEEIIEAMVQNYRLKLQILEQMLQQIKERNGEENEKQLPIS